MPRNTDGSALFCAVTFGSAGMTVHASWCGGIAAPSSRYASDHMRKVSGGRPVMAQEQATHSSGDPRANA